MSGALHPSTSREVLDRFAALFHVPTAAEIAACNHCGGDGKIRCEDPECFTCAIDFYCGNAMPCSCTFVRPREASP